MTDAAIRRLMRRLRKEHDADGPSWYKAGLRSAIATIATWAASERKRAAKGGKR